MTTNTGHQTWTDPDDAPELTEAMLADAEVFQGDEFVKRGPGRPKTGNARELISVRLDRDVVARLREAGPGWQSQVNPMLRAALGLDGPPAERSPELERSVAAMEGVVRQSEKVVRARTAAARPTYQPQVAAPRKTKARPAPRTVDR